MSMQKLQTIRKNRAALSSERMKLKKEAMNLRLEERDAKNELLQNFLDAGNFEQTHGDVRRIKPCWRSMIPESLRDAFVEWEKQCDVYDNARTRLINQKVELLYGLQGRAEDLTQFIAINFRTNRKEV